MRSMAEDLEQSQCGYENGEKLYQSVKALHKCACGHERRVHVVKRNHYDDLHKERENRKVEPWGRGTPGGKCLGGMPGQPMSCECKGFGA